MLAVCWLWLSYYPNYSIKGNSHRCAASVPLSQALGPMKYVTAILISSFVAGCSGSSSLPHGYQLVKDSQGRYALHDRLGAETVGP